MRVCASWYVVFSTVRQGLSDGRQDVRGEAEDDDGASNTWSTLSAAALLHDAIQRQNTSGQLTDTSTRTQPSSLFSPAVWLYNRNHNLCRSRRRPATDRNGRALQWATSLFDLTFLKPIRWVKVWSKYLRVAYLDQSSTKLRSKYVLRPYFWAWLSLSEIASLFGLSIGT